MKYIVLSLLSLFSIGFSNDRFITEKEKTNVILERIETNLINIQSQLECIYQNEVYIIDYIKNIYKCFEENQPKKFDNADDYAVFLQSTG